MVDELAAVIQSQHGADHQRLLVRIAELGRSAGVHLIAATQRPSTDVCPNALKANVPARLALTTATMQDSRVILDRNGAEELTSPGQAILVRGTEMFKVMTPHLPDGELEIRLRAFEAGQLELTPLEWRVLEIAQGLERAGQPVTVRAVYGRARGDYNRVAAALKRLRQWGRVR